MRAELIDSLTPLFPDSRVSRNPVERFTLHTARDAFLAVHILVEGLKPGAALAFRVRAGNRPVSAAEWYRLVDVPVEENTGLSSFTARDGGNNPHVIRKAPFRVFDAMQPVVSPVKVAAPAVALRLQIPTRGEKSGQIEYEIEVAAGRERRALRLTAVVHAAKVPPVGKNSWPYTNWFSYETIAKRHGLALWSPRYWQMLERYARLMLRARQNMFWLPHLTVISRGKDGLVFERARAEKIVALFDRIGFHFIEGPHLAQRKWESPTFNVIINGPPAASYEGHRELALIARQLMAAIAANGWRKRWAQHIADEPTDAQAADYRIIAGIARKYMPGIPLMDALGSTALVGSVDWWCPLTLHYHNDRAKYDALRQFGDRIWVYTCLAPGGKHLNRLLDQENLRPLLFGWAGACFDLHGYLHWGLNHYRAWQDPFKMSVVGQKKEGKRHHLLPAGDTHVVYPGADGPWSSLRLEAQREGIEDYELLMQLKARNEKSARRIIGRVFRKFDDYTKDVSVYRAAKRMLLEALDR